MDLVRFDAMLANQLGDATGVTYTATMRTIAMSNAVRTYARFRSFQRRYGFGAIYTTIAQSGTTLYFLGLGGATFPLQVVLDYGTKWAETVTIQSVARPAPEDNLDSTALVATLAAPTAQIHYAGGMIWQASPGLPIVAGVDTYVMSYDFIEPDDDTWDQATGSRRWVKRQESYYDGVYSNSEKIGGVGWGQSQSFGASPGYGRGFVGLTALSSGNLGVSGGGEGQWIFNTASPTTLRVIPVPQSSTVLDFMYVAQPTPQEVPDAVMDALLFLAVASCYDQQISILGGELSFSEADTKESPDTMIRALRDAADAARKRFDDYIRNLPILIAG